MPVTVPVTAPAPRRATVQTADRTQVRRRALACAYIVWKVKLTPVQLDCGAALALAAIATVEISELKVVPRPVVLILVLLSVLPAAVRRLWPRTVLAVVTVAAAVVLALFVGDPVPQFAVAFVSYLIPAQLPRREAIWALGGTLATLAAGLAVFAVTRHGGPYPGGTRAALSALAENGLLVAGSWIVGYTICQQRAYRQALRVQAERDDRIRIARELHDVVAHGLSLIAVQAGVANWVVESQPAEAARALASIEEISRGALREMRALLGVLRVDSDPAAEPDLAPAHSLADLNELTGRVTAAGIRVDLDVRGTPAAVLPGLELAAYRVIQEAVTNVIKHSGAGRCQVLLTYAADAITVRVADDGTAGPDQPAGHGHGLTGMRERVAMYDGTFEAGPRPDGGFAVTARFPLAAPASGGQAR
jgi:signal transduction histidine kinase